MGEDVANAMDLRCFGQGPRTWLTKLEYHWLDYALIAFSILMLLAGLVLVYWFNIGDFWVPEFYLNWALG
jgi:energy-coupling factor transport system permease protein